MRPSDLNHKFEQLNVALRREILAMQQRLDAHNRVMTSLTERIRALEQQARPEQEDGELAVERGAPAYELLRGRAEDAERERDKAIEEREYWRDRFNDVDPLYLAARAARPHSPLTFTLCDQRDAALDDVERLSVALRKVEKCTGCNACRGLADALKETP